MQFVLLLNPLITPDPGLIIWTIVIFGLLVLILSKFAFKPIVSSLKDRQDSIETALNAANKAKEEMSQLVAKNEELLLEAKEERNIMLLEAKDIATKIVEESREKAKKEYTKLIDNARKDFEAERLSAMMQLKNEAGKLAVDIAEKLVRKELTDKKSQEELVSSLINEAKFN